MGLDRRDFLAMLTLGSAASLVTIFCSRNQKTLPMMEFVPQFSGEITRLALINDATVLALQDQTLPELVRRALKGTAGLSSILGMGLMFPAGGSIVSFLAEARRNLFESKTDNDEHRVAIAMGYLMHRAVEHRIREGLVAAGIDAGEENTAKLQQDAEVIRSLLINSPKTQAEVEALLFVLDQRLRIKVHTLNPDGTDEKAWVMKLLEWDAAQENLFKKLAATLAGPNAKERFLYVESLNFFDKDSPLIAAARRPKGAELIADKTKKIKTRETSLYGRALEDCRRVITLADRFIDGSIDAEALVEKLN